MPYSRVLLFIVFSLVCSRTIAAEVSQAPVSSGMPAEVYTLDDAVRLALRNDAELQKAEQGITIARERVRQAALLFFPEVGLQSVATRYDARYPFALRPGLGSTLLFPSTNDNFLSGQAYMTFSIYEGGRHINTLRLAQAALKQAQSKYEAVKMDIIYNIKRVFYRLILAQKLLTSASELSASLHKSANSSRAGGWDEVEQTASLAELRTEEAGLNHELELTRLEFLKGLNREFDANAVVDGKLETKSSQVDINQALVWATELRPELQSETYKAQMDAIAVNLVMGQRNPTIMFETDYQVTGNNFPLRDNNWDATIGLRIPFSFDFWTQHTEKLAEQRQGEIARAQLHDMVDMEVRKAYKDLIYWQEEWPRRENDYQRVKELYLSASQQNAQSAAKIRASFQLFKTHRRFLEAVSEHILARAQLERAIGRSLPER